MNLTAKELDILLTATSNHWMVVWGETRTGTVPMENYHEARALADKLKAAQDALSVSVQVTG